MFSRLILLLPLLLTACSPTPIATPSQSPPVPTPIGRLESRSQIIEITSTQHGPRYTLKSKSGQILLQNASLPELQARSPATANLLQTGIAWAGE